MNTLNLVLGDWSGDGHSKTDTVTIETNLSKKEVWEAYSAGAKLIGVDLCNSVAAEYEDNKICRDDVAKFADAGYECEIDDYNSIYTEEFTALFLFTVSKGRPDFVYEICKNQDLHIGGYGLYE